MELNHARQWKDFLSMQSIDYLAPFSACLVWYVSWKTLGEKLWDTQYHHWPCYAQYSSTSFNVLQCSKKNPKKKNNLSRVHTHIENLPASVRNVLIALFTFHVVLQLPQWQRIFIEFLRKNNTDAKNLFMKSTQQETLNFSSETLHVHCVARAGLYIPSMNYVDL